LGFSYLLNGLNSSNLRPAPRLASLAGYTGLKFIEFDALLFSGFSAVLSRRWMRLWTKDSRLLDDFESIAE